VFDTLDIARRLYPTWPSHSLERMATQLKVANGVDHRALSDTCLVKDIFPAMLKDIPTLKTIAELGHLSPPLTFAEAPVYAIDPPAGFEALTMAMTEQGAMTIIYERGAQQARPRKITPRLVLQVYGVAYVVAHCHQRGREKTCRLDRIQRCWLDEQDWVLACAGE
jgi:WYL domain